MKWTVFLVCILLISLNGQAQSDSAQFSFKEFLGYNLNPGISMGLGGGRPRGYLPQPTIKVGRFELGISPPYDVLSYTISGSQLDVELYRFKGYNDKSAAIVGGLGISIQEYQLNRVTTEIGNVSILLGANQKVGKRSELAIKIGVLNNQMISYLGDSYYNSPNYRIINETYTTYPYGEIAYKLYAFPFGEKQKVIRKLARGEIVIDQEKLRKGFSNWFNPYFSIGLGLDRALITPAAGIKIGPINGKVSFWDDLTAAGMFAANANLDVYKLKSADDVKAYLGIGASYFYSYSGDINGSSSDVLSFSGNYNRYNLNKRTSLEIKAGAGYAVNNQSSYDFATNEQTTTIRKGIVPFAGVSYNIYVFKFR